MADTISQGAPSYADAHDPKYGEPHLVPLKLATQESLQGFGHLVKSFKNEEVEITTWPQKGWRPICPGTGCDGGIVEGEFPCFWKDDVLAAKNMAVNADYIIGRLPKDVSYKDRTYILTREANYHPDGGQVFFPTNNTPFILLLALPGDDIELEDFVAFYFDGTCGVQIKADIWHQGVFCIEDKALYLNKLGKVHACVEVDTVKEFGKFLKVPLKPELAM